MAFVGCIRGNKDSDDYIANTVLSQIDSIVHHLKVRWTKTTFNYQQIS